MKNALKTCTADGKHKGKLYNGQKGKRIRVEQSLRISDISGHSKILLLLGYLHLGLLYPDQMHPRHWHSWTFAYGFFLSLASHLPLTITGQ